LIYNDILKLKAVIKIYRIY